MIVTEEEAKTKRCQESFGDRSTDPTGATYSVAFPMNVTMGAGGVLHTSPSMCIGSACMAWRWATIVQEREAGSSEEEYEDTIRGYCGKAGRP